MDAPEKKSPAVLNLVNGHTVADPSPAQIAQEQGIEKITHEVFLDENVLRARKALTEADKQDYRRHLLVDPQTAHPDERAALYDSVAAAYAKLGMTDAPDATARSSGKIENLPAAAVEDVLVTKAREFARVQLANEEPHTLDYPDHVQPVMALPPRAVPSSSAPQRPKRALPPQ